MSSATAAQIADAMRISMRQVRRRADAENWTYTEEPVSGGLRRLYQVEHLPAAARAQLIWMNKPAADATPEARAAAATSKAEAARLVLRGGLKARAAETRRTAALRQADEMSASAQARLDARLAVVRAFETFAAELAVPVAEAQLMFAHRYNAGEVPVLRGVLAALPRIGERSLREWQRKIRAEGVTALAGAYGNRAGTSKVDSQPELLEYCKGLLVGYPHARATQLLSGLRAHFGPAARLPALRNLEVWVKRWRADNAEILAALGNPDAWRNKYMTAFGSRSEDVLRVNQRWELDSSPADLLCTDGRHCLIGGIDVFTRRPRLLVAKTSKAVAVAALLRRMLLDFGVPEEAKTDNGSDYVSSHIVRVFAGLDVKHTLCTPFSPDQKPHIERFFGTFSRDLAELLPGYIGHSVADRKAIESRRSFAERLMKREEVVEVRLTGEELQTFCDDWVDSVYMHSPHQGAGINGRTPLEVLAASADELRRIPDERALDVLLAEAPENSGWRTVQKKGIRVDDAWFIAPELHAWVGERVHTRYDALEHDLGRLYVFGHVAGQGEQVFICLAECPERTGMDRREVAAKARHLQRQHMQAARKALKSTARRMGTDQLVQEVLLDRAQAAGKLALLPVRTAAHTSPGLAAAASAVQAAQAPQRTTADIENLAAVQAARERIAAQQVPAGAANELAARRGPVPAPVFETVAQRVQWLLQQRHTRALADEERETLAEFRRVQPASYRRMNDLVAGQMGPAKENAPDGLAGPSGAV